MTYIPPPKTLPAFPDAKTVRPKTPLKGRGYRKRWKDSEFIYEWDSFHGRVEKYDKQGKHLGEFDYETGERTKDPEPGRSIEV
jgi:hypothetical protein